ncbi:hypothetical protein [Anthocerotibacter panamensis]|uniref:hypothetical protein n=1 Tax=Anthocerotibacter panamensis TaxID=2857077 RepID=UPI001C4066C3|nr:hypothetical protein [Anthocerotibacter panamensis]
MQKRKPWFGETTEQLQLVAYLQRMSSWQQAIADGKITAEEIRLQAEKVVDLLKSVQPLLTDPQKSQLTRILYEMAVLQAMQTTALTSTLRL